MNAGKVVIDLELGTKGFDAQIDATRESLEQMVDDYNVLQRYSPYEGQEDDLKNLEIQIERTSNKLSELVSKQNELNRNGVEKMSKGFNSVIKNTGKWVLAIFSVRGAYSLIRQAMSSVLQYNDALANQLESVKYTLAMAIEPVISKIVNLIYTLMQYLQYIIKAWTGKDIFANANKSLKGANKSAKDLQKTMFGFDTANVLSDGGSSGGGAGGGGAAPINPLGEGDVPEWLRWIGENKETVVDFFTQIASIIAIAKIGEFLLDLADIAKVVKNIAEFIGKNGKTLGGIGLIVGGLIEFVKSLIAYFKDPTWENFSGVLLGISLVVGGIALLFGGIPALIALIVGAVIALGAAIYKNWDKIKGWFSNIGQWINDKIINPIKDKFNSLPGWMKTLIRGIVNTAISTINSLIKGLNAMLLPLRAVILAVGKVMGKNWSLSTIKIPTIPKLAVGGVINMPGKGVYRGGANIAERGPEGVIPLTNDQSLQMIADAIAQKMNVTLDITNKIDGRILNRQLEQVRANNSFARNGA